MSWNRDNVIWQSADGSWNRGFYKVVWTGDDPEWDVEYDYDQFEWVSTGHASEEDADDSWNGSNPGMSTIVEYDGNEDDCDKYDKMALDYENYDRYGDYYGW